MRMHNEAALIIQLIQSTSTNQSPTINNQTEIQVWFVWLDWFGWLNAELIN